jgi:hypothetical protein
MKDDNNQVILPPSFEALGWSDGSFSVIGDVTGYRLKGMWGLVNLKKEFVTKAQFEDLVYAGGENIVARKKVKEVFQKRGCLNLKGEIKIPFDYDGILIQGLRAIVFNLTKSGFQYGLIDLTNKSILPVYYKYIRPLGSLRYAIENSEGKIALFSEEGKPVTDFVIDIKTIYKDWLIGKEQPNWKQNINPLRFLRVAKCLLNSRVNGDSSMVRTRRCCKFSLTNLNPREKNSFTSEREVCGE